MLKSGFPRGMVAMLMLSAFAMAGCGDSNSVTGSVPTGGANLANTPISAANAVTVFASANQAIGNVIASVFAQASKKPVASPALAKSFSSVTVNGKSSGKITASGDYNSGSSDVSMTSKVTFDNFSDDGKLFSGGTLDISYSLPNSNPQGITSTYKGSLAFAGDFKGTMSFDITNSGGKLSGFYKIGRAHV